MDDSARAANNPFRISKCFNAINKDLALRDDFN
jgi:hypothetical protein